VCAMNNSVALLMQCMRGDRKKVFIGISKVY